MREPESLEDSTLDRELQELLSVNPSLDFVARVQMTVAQKRPGRTLGGVWVVGALAAAAASIVIAISVSTPKETVNADAEPRVVSHSGRDIELPVVSATRPIQQPARRATSTPLPRAPRTSSVVMVWREDAEGLDELIRDVTEQRFEVAAEGAILSDEGSLVNNQIAPIVFEPIELSPIEGVFQ